MRDPYAITDNPYSNSNGYSDPYSAYSRSSYAQAPAFSYVRNNRANYRAYDQNRAEMVEAGAGVGLAGAGTALFTGKVSAGLVGAKLAAAGLAIGSGGMVPLIGAAAPLGAGNA